MIKFFEPPFLLKAEHSFIEDKIKSFSTNLFKNKIYGYLNAIIFNLYFIIFIFKKKNLITIFLEYVIFYLIEYIVYVNLFNIERK